MLNKAITLTKKTLQKRSSHYRNLVIVVSLLLFLSPIIALISFNWQFLLAWLLIPLAYSIFLYFDQSKLSYWQLTILSYWQDDQLKLHFLEQSLMHLPIFPENTIKSMVELLPQPEESDNLSIKTRKLIVNIQKIINHCNHLNNIYIILTFTIIFVCILYAFLYISLLSLLFIFFLIPIFLIKKYYIKLLKVHITKDIKIYCNDKKIWGILSNLSWYPLIMEF